MKIKRIISISAILLLVVCVQAQEPIPENPLEKIRVNHPATHHTGISISPASGVWQDTPTSSPSAYHTRVLCEVGGFISGLWSYDRYVTKQPWAMIGTNSIKANFQHGFEWDRREFGMNQILHPYSYGLSYTCYHRNGQYHNHPDIKSYSDMLRTYIKVTI